MAAMEEPVELTPIRIRNTFYKSNSWKSVENTETENENGRKPPKEDI